MTRLDEVAGAGLHGAVSPAASSSRAAEMRAILGVEFCKVCQQDTLPLDTGRCGFCDYQIIPPKGRVWTGRKPAPLAATAIPEPLPAPDHPAGHCQLCGEKLPVDEHAGNAARRKFCSQSCKQGFWRKYTVEGRACVRRGMQKRAA